MKSIKSTIENCQYVPNGEEFRFIREFIRDSSVWYKRFNQFRSGSVCSEENEVLRENEYCMDNGQGV